MISVLRQETNMYVLKVFETFQISMSELFQFKKKCLGNIVNIFVFTWLCLTLNHTFLYIKSKNMEILLSMARISI